MTDMADVSRRRHAKAHAASGWPLELDWITFATFLRGYSANECADAAVQSLRNGGSGASFLDMSVPGDRAIILQDIQDHYRTIDFLLPYLYAPDAFVALTNLPISLADKQKMVRLFYELDEHIARPLFGSRLSKNDIEDLEENLQDVFPEEYIERHVENIKRLCHYGACGYRNKDGICISRLKHFSAVLSENFALPSDIADQYFALMFGYEHRLQTPCLAGFTLPDLVSLCAAMSTLCDSTGIFLPEEFPQQLGRLKSAITANKVVVELQALIFHEARARTPTAQPTVATNASGAEKKDSQPPTLDPQQQGAAHSRNVSSSSSSFSFSRRCATEFPMILRSLARAFSQFLQVPLGELLESACDKVLYPYGVGPRAPGVSAISTSTTTASDSQESPAVELSMLLGQISARFPELRSVSQPDHLLLDDFVRSLFGVLKLYLQLTLSHRAQSSCSVPRAGTY